MTEKLNRRMFTATTAGLIVGSSTAIVLGQDGVADRKQTKDRSKGPVEKPFERDYDKPKFSPKWEKKVLNRTMVQDFVILAHSDLVMVRKLYEREPSIINGTMDWGNGDWETALGGASHMARKDIIEFLLSKGARIDIFCAATLGMLETVKQMLTFQPALIDAPGPHGAFNLHHHANCAVANGEPHGQELLDYLQSVKEKPVRNFPFLKKKQPQGSGKRSD